MTRRSIFIAISTLTISLFAAAVSFAQPCLLGVGPNCPKGTTVQNTTTEKRFVLGQALSADAMKHLNYGSRYLLRLSTPYADPNGSGCSIEQRAYVAAVEGNNGSQITVKIGPVFSVRTCAAGSVPTVEQVNHSEDILAYSRKSMVYVQSNPRSFPNQQAWMNYYQGFIDAHTKFINQGVQ